MSGDLPDSRTARATILAGLGTVGTETVALGRADGRYLAQPVRAGLDAPPFDAAAMDGWAVRSADLSRSDGLVAAGETTAGGSPPAPLRPGEAHRIFTGAPLPPGADRVVEQERAAISGDRVRFAGMSDRRHVRARGADFTRGQELLPGGARLDGWNLGLLAAAGLDAVTVMRRPRVALVTTGDELVAPGTPLPPGASYDSNGPALTASTEGWGGEVVDRHRLRDDAAALSAAVAASDADLIVVVGGASVGRRDVAKPALLSIGLDLLVPGVAMRPGKPTWSGRLPDGRPVLGLPGNPAAALVAATLFLRPILAAMQGGDPSIRLRRAALVSPLAPAGAWEHWLRARATDDGVVALDDQDTSFVTRLAAADLLIRRASRAPAAEAGSAVETLPLDRLR